MEVLADAAMVEVPRSELPDVYPSLWLPAEVYHRQSFFVRLFVPAETPGEPRGALLARGAAALGSGTLTARCFATTADLALQQRVASDEIRERTLTAQLEELQEKIAHSEQELSAVSDGQSAAAVIRMDVEAEDK